MEHLGERRRVLVLIQAADGINPPSIVARYGSSSAAAL